MIKFEYVASGMGNTRWTRMDLERFPDTIELIRTTIKSIQGRNNHNFSMLYNGYIERTLGNTLWSRYRDVCMNIHADSGGLQMITRGKVSTDELKASVYEQQAHKSTIAMSFDEIPLVLTADKSTFHDMDSRYFDEDLLEEKARESGKNLLKQILYFKEHNAISRPFLIVQGNCLRTYQLWMNYITEEVGLENLNYVAGVASGAASLGQGMLEDFKRFFILEHMQWPTELNTNHFHILGMAITPRFTPLAALHQKKNAFEGKTISYDATTQTGAVNRGQYYVNGSVRRLTKGTSIPFLLTLNDINQHCRELGLPEITADALIKRISVPQQWTEEHGFENPYEEYSVLNSFFIGQVLNLNRDIDKMVNEKKGYDNWVQTNHYETICNEYANCRDWKDIEAWETTYGQYIKSKAVKSKHQLNANLEEFFG